MGHFVFLLLAMVLAAPAHGQDNNPDLRGVGMVVQAGHGGCTGTLVAPDLVLTAAHCLTGRGEDHEFYPAHRYTFSPTTIGGVPGRVFRGKSVAVHPIFLIMPTGLKPKRRRDIGLIRLAKPVPVDLATPLTIAPPDVRPEKGFLLSFRGPHGGPLRHRSCPVISDEDQFLVIGCEVVSGESGSPFLVVKDGIPSVYGVVSSRFRLKEQPVGLAAVVGNSFDGVLAAIQTGQGR